MKKIGSEFIDDFEKDEKTLFGISYRIILLFITIILSIGLIVLVSWLELPEIIYEIYIIVFATPCIFFGVSGDKLLKIRERIYFFFLIKRRVYKTDITNNKKGD